MNLPDMIVGFNSSSSICTYSTIFLYYIFIYFEQNKSIYTLIFDRITDHIIFGKNNYTAYFCFLKKEYIKKLLNAACCSLLRCPPGSVFLQTSLQPYFSLFHEHNCQPNMRTKY